MISIKIEEIAGDNGVKFTVDNLDTATDAEKEALSEMLGGLKDSEEQTIQQPESDNGD